MIGATQTVLIVEHREAQFSQFPIFQFIPLTNDKFDLFINYTMRMCIVYIYAWYTRMYIFVTYTYIFLYKQ